MMCPKGYPKGVRRDDLIGYPKEVSQAGTTEVSKGCVSSRCAKGVYQASPMEVFRAGIKCWSSKIVQTLQIHALCETIQFFSKNTLLNSFFYNFTYI